MDRPPDPSRRAVVGWVLYDLANVVFAINILSLYFPLWVVDDAGGSDGHLGVASGLSMAAVLVAAPFLGALSDLAPRRVPFLVVSTAVCCALTLGLGRGGLAASLVVFALANAVFQSGLIFYDALLPVVSTPANRGRIGGYGIAAGYGGSLLGIAVGLTVLGLDEGAKPLVFTLTAVLFALGAIPCFLWVREPERPGSTWPGRAAARAALRELRAAPAHIRRTPGMGRFLLGRACYSDAANTVVVFMGVYVTNEIGFSDLQAQLVLLAGIVAGPFGALATGAAVDRIGPKRTLRWVLALWVVALGLIVAVPVLGLPVAAFWLAAPLVGIALGATPTADRIYLLRLAPPAQRGHYLGLYAMAGRFSAVVGPLLWALTVDGLGLGRPVAVATLLVLVVVAAVILAPIDEMPRSLHDTDAISVA